MITENGKYYLYRHIRKDTNEVFYVGMATYFQKYRYALRAFSKCGRSKEWRDIANVTEYDVDVLLDSNDKEFIMKKEREFISLYGRIDLNTGTLCNLNDGGKGGNIGETSKKRIRESLKNAGHSKRMSDYMKVFVERPELQTCSCQQ